MVINPYPKFDMPMSKSTDILPESRFFIRILILSSIVMNERDTSYHGDTLTCKSKTMSKDKKGEA